MDRLIELLKSWSLKPGRTATISFDDRYFYINLHEAREYHVREWRYEVNSVNRSCKWEVAAAKPDEYEAAFEEAKAELEHKFSFKCRFELKKKSPDCSALNN